MKSEKYKKKEASDDESTHEYFKNRDESIPDRDG
jgi:hypothetical protein